MYPNVLQIKHVKIVINERVVLIKKCQTFLTQSVHDLKFIASKPDLYFQNIVNCFLNS